MLRGFLVVCLVLSLLDAHRLFEVSESVASAFDVEDVAVVEESVEDGGGEDFVAGEEFGPVADAFVGGDEDAASAVAVGDHAEEEAGFLSGHVSGHPTLALRGHLLSRTRLRFFRVRFAYSGGDLGEAVGAGAGVRGGARGR